MFGALFTWGSIFTTHLFFRKHLRQSNTALKFKIPGSHMIAIFGLLAILSITITTWFTAEFKSTLQFGVPFVVILILSYWAKNTLAKRNVEKTERQEQFTE